MLSLGQSWLSLLSRFGTQETKVTQVRSKNRISVRYLFLINKVPKSSEDPKRKTQGPSNPKGKNTKTQSNNPKGQKHNQSKSKV